MNKLKELVIALFFIFQLISHALAAASVTDNVIIWQANANEIIRYLDQDTPNPGKNNHPVVLQAKEINTILESIKFNQNEEHNLSTKKAFKSVFTEQQANLLGKYLVLGLKSAKPHQDIIFVLQKSVKRSSFLKPARYFIAGRVFYKDNKLNIIIGDYNRLRDEAFEAVSDPTNTGNIHYSFNYGQRSSASSFKKVIININGIEHKQQKNTRREDWLVIDVNLASKAIEQITRVRNKEAMADRRQKLIEVLGSEETIRIDEKNSLQKVTRSIEERLIELKQLRNKDLITVEEFAQKRKKILDDL